MEIKKNKVIIIAAAVLAVILAVVICVLAGQRPSQPADPTTAPTADPGTKPTLPTVSTEPVEPTEGTDAATVPETTEPEPTETTARPPQPTVPPTEPVTEPVVDPIPETTVPTGVRFPYAIPGTELVIEAVNPYTGVFLEDGSDADANDIYAIILRNKAPTCVEYISITLTRDDGKELSFVASAIDADSRIVVMEAHAEEYVEADYDACSADVAQIPAFEMSGELIRVEESKNGALLVTNISDTDIPCVRLFYKFYMEDVNVYVGGITYTAKIEYLAAGETKTVMPSHYARDSSRVVMIKVYDTVE